MAYIYTVWGPSLHHLLVGLLQLVLYPALLLADGYETTYVPSLRFCSTTPASGISSTSHTRITSHKRRGVCRYAIKSQLRVATIPNDYY